MIEFLITAAMNVVIYILGVFLGGVLSIMSWVSYAMARAKTKAGTRAGRLLADQNDRA